MSQASMSQAAAPSLGQAFDMLTIATPGSGLHDVTREVAERLARSRQRIEVVWPLAQTGAFQTGGQCVGDGATGLPG